MCSSGTLGPPDGDYLAEIAFSVKEIPPSPASIRQQVVKGALDMKRTTSPGAAPLKDFLQEEGGVRKVKSSQPLRFKSSTRPAEENLCSTGIFPFVGVRDHDEIGPVERGGILAPEKRCGGWNWISARKPQPGAFDCIFLLRLGWSPSPRWDGGQNHRGREHPLLRL